MFEKMIEMLCAAGKTFEAWDCDMEYRMDGTNYTSEAHFRSVYPGAEIVNVEEQADGTIRVYC